MSANYYDKCKKIVQYTRKFNNLITCRLKQINTFLTKKSNLTQISAQTYYYKRKVKITAFLKLYSLGNRSIIRQ